MEQLFLEVVNMSIIASVIILCVVILHMFLKKVPTIFSYMLWGIVFFRLLCPISFESAIGIFPSTIVPVVEDNILGGTMNEQQELNNQSIVHQAIQLKDHTSIVEKTNITTAVEEVILDRLQ